MGKKEEKNFFPNKKQTAFGHFLLPIIYPNGFAACFKSVSGGQAAEVGSGVLSLLEELGTTDVNRNIYLGQSTIAMWARVSSVCSNLGFDVNSEVHFTFA